LDFWVCWGGWGREAGWLTDCDCRGYVALAVSCEKGTFTREIEQTGHKEDRQANMVAFAVEAFKLLRDVIKGDAKL